MLISSRCKVLELTNSLYYNDTNIIIMHLLTN